MAPPSRPRTLRLALAALCLLALPSDARARRDVHPAGGRQELAPDAPQVQKAAQEAVDLFNQRSPYRSRFRLLRVLGAQSQPDEEAMYYLMLELGRTACPTVVTGEDMELPDISTCPLATGAQQETLHCEFKMNLSSRRNASEMLWEFCHTV
ncbi:cystatin-M-like [Tamandua tetradactyla]|uniref:cystatin-M-like n=1 Tax=Tamandua tetradactyla TaxID=48850 RepID=UPI00405472D2